MTWRYDAGASITATAAVHNSTVLIGDLGGWVHAVTRDTGERLWRKGRLGEVWGSVSTNEIGVFVADDLGTVTALGLDDGSLLWEYQTGDAIYGGTSVFDGLVYVVSYDSWVYALDTETGEMVWKSELRLGSNSTPAVSHGLVLIGSWDDRVYALDAKSGRLKWNFWTGDDVVSSVTATDDSVYFGSADGYLYAVDASSGTLNWRYRIGNSIESTPEVSQGLVYVGANDGWVYAIDVQTGSLAWKFETENEVQAPVLVHGNTVYVGSHDSNIYAIAAGFQDDYLAPPAEPASNPDFTPLSPEELKQRLTEAFGSQQPVFASVAVFGPDGKTIEEIDGSSLVIEIFENGYYLLTGRSVQQDGWEARYFSVEDYNALAEERGDPGLRRSLGWCCIRTDEGLALIMRADRPLDSATATTAHEAGHALQRLLNPVQNKAPRDSLIGAMREAEAYSFEVALARKIGEYTGVEIARLPTGYRWRAYLDQQRENFKESVNDLTMEHPRGRLIMWLAVLHDPELADLREELERNGFLSADSVYQMFLRFTSLTPSEIEPYIEAITPERLGDSLNYFSGVVNKRAGYVIEFTDLVLNVPILAISP
ncbi:MAG: PQQ-binding-like beta-propeller repeat protein [Dehalococcoidia bacterium]|nr:PQQ-binding-like beta-propeller repeat protein [Dehalococcoidia bacterium]